MSHPVPGQEYDTPSSKSARRHERKSAMAKKMPRPKYSKLKHLDKLIEVTDRLSGKKKHNSATHNSDGTKKYSANNIDKHGNWLK